MGIITQEGPEGHFIRELTDEQFNLWLHHPITEMFIAYLGREMDEYRMAHLARWESYQALPPEQQQRIDLEERGRILMLEDLQRINLSVIKRLYLSEQESDIERDGRPNQAD